MAYRKDKDVTKQESGDRRMLVHLLPSRDQSSVFFTQTLDVTHTLEWLDEYNATHERRLSLLVLYMCAAGRMYHRRPRINRYASGWHIYERDGVTISVSAKKQLKEKSKIVLLKMPMGRDDMPEDVVDRFKEMLGEGREKEIAQEKEADLFLNVPGFILNPAVKLLMWLDRRHWLPGALVDPDPFFTTMVLANLGSVGLDAAYHHLYEWGNATYFAVIGRIHERPLGVDGEIKLRKLVEIKYTFDERVADGLATGIGMAGVKDLVEHPERFYEEMPEFTDDPAKRVSV